jgi:hypothetical protein
VLRGRFCCNKLGYAAIGTGATVPPKHLSTIDCRQDNYSGNTVHAGGGSRSFEIARQLTAGAPV